jgi:hypothetical protein
MTPWHQLLDRLAAGDCVVGAEDARGWDAHVFERAISLGLLREAEEATTVRCDNCAEGHWADVIRVGARAFIACPEAGPCDVDPQRLRQWRIDASRLAEVLKLALELAGRAEPIAPQLWHLGRLRVAGRFRDFFLTAGETHGLGRDVDRLLRYDGWTSGVLLVPRAGGSGANSPKLRIIDLRSVIRDGNNELAIDLDPIADCFADGVPPEGGHAHAIAAPVGTSWNEVSVALGDQAMEVTIRGRTSERDYSQAGFRASDQRLVLLRLFGAARGVLDRDKVASVLDGGTPLKARISRLRQLLQDLIEVDGDPIEHNKKAGTYRCRFEIRLADEWGYPTPDGATWSHFAFHERSDGRLVVSVTASHRFRARGLRAGDSGSTEEVAEAAEASQRTYSLEDLRLRTPAGRLTPEGTALVGLLRSRGRLSGRGDDLGVLKLARLLREWTGLEEDPLRFSDATRSWNALFACSSDLRPAE